MGYFKVNEKDLMVQVGFNNSADILKDREAEWDILAGIAVNSQDKTLIALFEKLPVTSGEFLETIGGVPIMGSPKPVEAEYAQPAPLAKK